MGHGADDSAGGIGAKDLGQGKVFPPDAPLIVKRGFEGGDEGAAALNPFREPGGDGIAQAGDIGQDERLVAVERLALERYIIDHVEGRVGADQRVGQAGEFTVEIADLAAGGDAVDVDHLGGGAGVEIRGDIGPDQSGAGFGLGAHVVALVLLPGTG